MRFTEQTIFHIYNQGNNRQQIFFNEENYLFFLKKMREYLLPYGDLLCYCLMPNHFHWLMYVRNVEVSKPSEAVTQSHRLTTQTPNAQGTSEPIEAVTSSHCLNNQRLVPDSSEVVTPSHHLTTQGSRNLNDSIAILLRSYTRAINIQESRSGSLFRKETKAKAGWEDVTLPPSHPSYGQVLQNWELYGSTCFNYIHNNPVAAKLVAKSIDWPYSSAPDFAGLRAGTLCNQRLAKELLFYV